MERMGKLTSFNSSQNQGTEVRINSFQGRHLSTKDLTCTESDNELTRDGQETQTLDVELGRKHHAHHLHFPYLIYGMRDTQKKTTVQHDTLHLGIAFKTQTKKKYFLIRIPRAHMKEQTELAVGTSCLGHESPHAA